MLQANEAENVVEQAGRILVVDDDRGIRKGISLALRRKGYEVTEAADGVEGESTLKREPFDLVITDLEMPGLKGIELLKRVRALSPDTITMVISGFATIERAVEAMKEGAEDFIQKGESFSVDELEVKVGRLLKQRALTQENRRLAEENRALREEISGKYRFTNIIGRAPALRRVFERMEKVVEDGRVTVLIRGESGTGKELVAKALHYNGPRRDAPFIAINCAAIPDTLLESELFGHEKGAFTDAIRRKIGRFEAGHRGSVFLDEIGDLSAKLQIKLLRVLQERRFERVGGSETIEIDVRVIAATNRDLEQAIEEGSFRKDLYYRLNVVPIEIPPLRERVEDIPLLADHFLRKFNEEKGKNLSVSPEVMEVLCSYDWQGNIRELENLIEQLVILTSGDVIREEHLPVHLRKTDRQISVDIPIEHSNLKRARKVLVTSFEKRFIRSALERNDWNITHTAREIGESREGLHRKIKKYGLRRDE